MSGVPWRATPFGSEHYVKRIEFDPTYRNEID